MIDYLLLEIIEKVYKSISTFAFILSIVSIFGYRYVSMRIFFANNGGRGLIKAGERSVYENMLEDLKYLEIIYDNKHQIV